MEWLIVAFLCWLGYLYLKSRTKQPAGNRPQATRSNAPPPPQDGPTYHWAPHKDYDHDFEVVGESNYQAALAKLAGDHGKQSPDLKTTAKLIPENDNPHDSSAVRVEIGGQTVGYLSRDDARGFRRRLGSKKLSGQITTCGAMIMGGFIGSNGKRASYGVVLDMKPFE